MELILRTDRDGIVTPHLIPWDHSSAPELHDGTDQSYNHKGGKKGIELERILTNISLLFHAIGIPNLDGDELILGGLTRIPQVVEDLETKLVLTGFTVLDLHGGKGVLRLGDECISKIIPEVKNPDVPGGTRSIQDHLLPRFEIVRQGVKDGAGPRMPQHKSRQGPIHHGDQTNL